MKTHSFQVELNRVAHVLLDFRHGSTCRDAAVEPNDVAAQVGAGLRWMMELSVASPLAAEEPALIRKFTDDRTNCHTLATVCPTMRLKVSNESPPSHISP